MRIYRLQYKSQEFGWFTHCMAYDEQSSRLQQRNFLSQNAGASTRIVWAEDAPTLKDACAACLHQLSTDSDLETVSAPDKYRELVAMLKRALYAIDPGFPPLQNYYSENEGVLEITA